MPTITKVLNWVDNTDKLVSQLEKGIGSIEKMSGAASRMVDAHEKSFKSMGKGFALLGGAAVAAGGAIIAMGQRGAAVKDVADSFGALSKSAGETGDVMLGSLRKGVIGTLSDFELMKLGNKALGAELITTAADFETLGAGARLLAKRTGGETAEAFDVLTSAIASGRTAQLKQLGLFVDSKVALDVFRKSIGVAVGDLTDKQRATALSAAALKGLREELKNNGTDMADFGELVDRGKVRLQNFTDSLGVAIAESPVVQAGMRVIGDAIESAFGSDQSQLVKTLIGYVNTFALTSVDMASVTIEAARAIGNAFFGIRAAVFELGNVWTIKVREMIDQMLFLILAQRSIAQLNPWADLSQYDNAAIKLGEIRTQIVGVGTSFGETANGALDDAGRMNAGLDGVQNTLGKTRAAMVAAAGAQVNHNAATDAGTAGQRKFSDGVEFTTAALKKQQDALNKAAAELLAQKVLFANLDTDEKKRRQEMASELEKELLAQKVLFANLDTEAAASVAARTEAQAAAWRQYYNWLGERRMEDDAAQMASMSTWRENLSQLSSALSQLAQVSGGTFGGIVQGLASVIVSLNTANKAVDSMTTGWTKLRGANKDVKGGLLDISTGAIGAGVALGQATAQGSTLNRTIGGMAAGAKIGSMFGPWGTAIGAAAGAVVGLVRGLSGVSAEVKKSREEVAAFQVGLAKTLTTQQQLEAGGVPWRMTIVAVRDAYLATGRSAADAERIVKQLWNTDNPKAARAAMEEINKVLAEQKKLFEENKAAATSLFSDLVSAARDAGEALPEHLAASIDRLIEMGILTADARKQFDDLAKAPSWAQMKQAAEALGLKFESLGTKFNGARVADEAELILSKFTLLKRGGVDVGDMLRQTSGRVSQLVSDAIATGTALPEQLREYVAELARTGQLYDDNRLKSNAWAKGVLENSRDIPAGLQDIIRKFMETGDMAMTADELMSQFGSNPAMAEIIRQMQAYDESIGDSNGQLRDLSRLNWAEPMERSINRLIAKFEELIDKILNGLAPALTNLPSPRLPDTTPDPGFRPERFGSNAFGGGVSAFLRGDSPRIGQTIVAAPAASPSSAPRQMVSVASGATTVIIVDGAGKTPDQIKRETLAAIPRAAAGNEHGIRTALNKILVKR